MLRSLGLMWLAFVQTAWSRLTRGKPRPTWSFQFQLVQRFLRLDWERTADWDLVRVRHAVDARPYPATWVKRAVASDGELGGVPTRTYAPKADARPGAILFFHGGSCVYGSAKTSHADLLARLAVTAKVEVIGVEYRLAPEHPYPAQLEDALAAFAALVARGVAPERVILAGDSAGGNIALTTQIALRDRGEPGAGALALLSPWVDVAMNGASFQENADLDFGTRAVLVRHAAAFAGTTPVDDPRISPTHAVLAGLPKTFVSWGTVETPRDDIVTFASRARAAGVEVTTHAAVDVPHNPAFFADYHPSAKASLDALVAFVDGVLDPASASADLDQPGAS